MVVAPSHESSRLDVLASCRIVGTPPEASFDALARLATLITGAPIAIISLVDRDRLWLKAARGIASGEHERAGSPCDACVLADAPLICRDLREDPRFAAHAYAQAARAYAAIPLHGRGHALGTLAVMHTRVHDWNEYELTQLRDLATQASALLELSRLRATAPRPSDSLLSSGTRISGIACFQWNMLTGQIIWTDEMFDMLDLDRAAFPTMELFANTLHPDDRGPVSARIELALRGELVDLADFRVVRKSGEVRILHANAELQRDENGRPVRLTGATQDVTLQRAAEETQRHALSALQRQKQESLGVLSAGVAHDFNNLLVGVLGNAELALADRSLSPTTSDLLERIVDAAQRAGTLTTQLLAYSGRSHLKLTELDLSTHVGAMVERLRNALPAGVVLESTLTAGLPAVRADLELLKLLTGNLVINGGESYEGPGTVTLRTHTHVVEADEPHDLSVPARLTPGRYVVLEVVDRGCGMSRHTLERALEPFFSTKFTGRGLGLSAALGIARAHSAVLTVDTRPGEGSRVRMHFPALDRPAAARALGEPGGTRSGELAGHTVLLVDDERMVRNVERLAMQRAGLKVLEAEDGEQAIAVLAQHRDEVDLVVLDLVMPGLDAASTLRGLREHRPDIPVIVQSGYPEEEVSRSLDEVDGRLDFLQKPFSVQTMLGKVSALLRK